MKKGYPYPYPKADPLLETKKEVENNQEKTL